MGGSAWIPVENPSTVVEYAGVRVDNRMWRGLVARWDRVDDACVAVRDDVRGNAIQFQAAGRSAKIARG